MITRNDLDKALDNLLDAKHEYEKMGYFYGWRSKQILKYEQFYYDAKEEFDSVLSQYIESKINENGQNDSM